MSHNPFWPPQFGTAEWQTRVDQAPIGDGFQTAAVRVMRGLGAPFSSDVRIAADYSRASSNGFDRAGSPCHAMTAHNPAPRLHPRRGDVPAPATVRVRFLLVGPVDLREVRGARC